MKTLIAIGKVAALFSSPLLLGLYVYDRSTGKLASWYTSPPTADVNIVAPSAEPMLLSGSKSFSGATVIDAGTLPFTEPATYVSTPASPPPTLSYATNGLAPEAPAMFPGTKSAAISIMPTPSEPQSTAQVHPLVLPSGQPIPSTAPQTHAPSPAVYYQPTYGQVVPQQSKPR